MDFLLQIYLSCTYSFFILSLRFKKMGCIFYFVIAKMETSHYQLKTATTHDRRPKLLFEYNICRRIIFNFWFRTSTHMHQQAKEAFHFLYSSIYPIRDSILSTTLTNIQCLMCVYVSLFYH